MWRNTKTQNMTTFKNLKCDKTQNVTKPKKSSKCDKTQQGSAEQKFWKKYFFEYPKKYFYKKSTFLNT